MVSLVKARADRMGQRRFSDSGGAVNPVCIPLENVLLTRIIGYLIRDLVEERLAGAIHTAEVVVIARLDRLKTPG